MAWPKTLRTQYIPRSVPKIKFDDLNAIQAVINSLFLGTVSVSGVVVDGTGGNNTVGYPGSFSVSASYSGTTLPTPISNTVPRPLSKESIPIGCAIINNSGQLITGNNVVSTSNLGVGLYKIEFNLARFTDTVNHAVLVQVDQNTNNLFFTSAYCNEVTNGVVYVQVYDALGKTKIDLGVNDNLNIFIFGV